MIEYSFLICGGGIIGLAIARELIKRGERSILVVEKEPELGMHASGRNSGVLHAGIYYTPDSLKAKFCIKGNEEMKQFCKEKKIPISECGKVIVARSESDINTLFELFRRAEKNGAQVRIVSEKELAYIEPLAKTRKFAIFSPNTASVDPKQILYALRDEIKNAGVEIMTHTKFEKLLSHNIAYLSDGKELKKVKFRFFINCGGLWADKIAHAFGVGRKYKILPFKGIYRKVAGLPIRRNIYPTPDLSFPFLGVHLTCDPYGNTWVGPNAMPCLGRENYAKFEGIGPETAKILLGQLLLFGRNPKLFRFVAGELSKIVRGFYSSIQSLVVRDAKPRVLSEKKVGIRAQLVDMVRGKLIMDFVVEKGENSVHILNAVSPAFTSAFPFARYVVENYVGF